MSAEPRARSLPHAVATRAPAPDFSLFDGDWVNRIFGSLGLGPWRPSHLVGRAAVLIALTWLPTAILAAWASPHGRAVAHGASFFTDFAAYAQFLIGLPLFVVAEAVVNLTTNYADSMFADTGIVRRADLPRLARLHEQIARLRDSPWSDIGALALGCALSGAVIEVELGHPPGATWHTYALAGGGRSLSAPAYWEFFVALPILNYWWLRQVWKVVLWCFYLYRVSRLRLALVATHPDRTGGIGFISQVQGHFAWLILAYGVSNVAATVGYKITVEHAELWMPPVWGPIVGFAVGAPLLFLLPLFMFTRQLYRTKRRARKLYRQRVIEQARLFEREVLPLSAAARTTMPAAIDLQLMARFSDLFERCEDMRIVPFDFRSMGELFAAVVGTVASILPAQQLAKLLPQAVGILRSIFGFLTHGSVH